MEHIRELTLSSRSIGWKWRVKQHNHSTDFLRLCLHVSDSYDDQPDDRRKLNEDRVEEHASITAHAGHPLGVAVGSSPKDLDEEDPESTEDEDAGDPDRGEVVSFSDVRRDPCNSASTFVAVGMPRITVYTMRSSP